MPRKLLAGLAIGLGSAALVLVIGWSGWLDVAELKTYDWRMRTVMDVRNNRGEPLVHPDIALVEINDSSIRDLEGLIGGRWPWPRVVYTTVIDFLKRAPARVIAFDVAFTEHEREATYPLFGENWTGARSDAALAQAVRDAGNVVMLADAVDVGQASRTIEQAPWSAPPYRLSAAIEERPVIVLPYDRLAAASAAFGHNF